jgi:hypothetical protein
MVMILLGYIWIMFLIITTLFILVAVVIEKNFDEIHPVKKWWRKHIVAPDPYEETPQDFNE